MILIVEDHRDLANVLLMVLGAAGYATQTVATGGEAIRAIRSDKPDIVILDIGLPDMPGWDVLSHVRADDAARQVRVVVFSSADNQAEAMAAGADAFLSKGVSDLDDVLATVRNFAPTR